MKMQPGAEAGGGRSRDLKGAGSGLAVVGKDVTGTGESNRNKVGVL